MASGTFSNLDIAGAPNLVFIADDEGRIVFVNAQWVAYTGRTVETLGSDRPGSPEGIVHPADLDSMWERWTWSVRTGEQFEMQYRLRSATDGRYRWFLTRAVAVRDNQGTIVQWTGSATDIDAQVRAGEGSRFLSDAAAVLSASFDREKIVNGFAKLATQRFCDGCSVVLAEGDILLRAAIAHKDPARFDRDAKDAVQVAPGGPVQKAIRSKRPILIATVTEEIVPTTDKEYLRRFRRMGVQSLMTAPMIIADRVIGAIVSISSDPATHFDERDLEVATGAARQVAVALENARSFERERNATARFEFLARATDRLFGRADRATKLQNLLDVMVEDIADWAAIYVLTPDGVRLDKVAHRDPAKAGLLAEACGERIFNAESERRLRARILRHRSTLQNDAAERFLRGIQPYLHPLFGELVCSAVLSVPLFTTDAAYGALSIRSSTRIYNKDDLGIMEEVARRIALAFEHEESLERERRLTRTLQEVTLPAQLANIPGAVVSTMYAPATTSDAQVGGDWYDIFELPNGRFLLSIGDVTGRGLQASAIMGKLHHSINVIAMYEDDPTKILDAAESILMQRYPDALATAFITLYDPAAQTFTFANAGHPYPLLRLRDGSIAPLEAAGVPIGLRTFTEPAQTRLRTTADVVLATFYTDGIIETNHDPLAGEALLREVLASAATPFVRNAANLIASSCLPKVVRDDVALLVVGFPESVSWSFDAENAKVATDSRSAFVGHLRQEGIMERDVHAAELIFGELVANAVRHAPGPVDIALEWGESAAILHVTDRGKGFTQTEPLRAELLHENGRGLWLIQEFGGEVEVQRIPGFGTHVRVKLPFARAANRGESTG